jgi:drug/metabolite transporter (DMT)-like permease
MGEASIAMRWNRWFAFVALCILSGTSWVIPHDGVDRLPPLEQQGILFGVLGCGALLFAGGRESFGDMRRRWVRLAWAAVGFLGVPSVVAEYTRGPLPVISRAALFAMVPIVIVMTLAARESVKNEERGARRLLIPALVGLGGLLLLLPLQFSSSVRAWISLGGVCAAVVLVGLASVWLYELLQGAKFVAGLAVTGVANSIFLLFWSALHEDTLWHRDDLASLLSLTSLTDLTEVLLIVWLLREMQPARFASRYLLIPLVTVLESYILMRPELTARMGFGTVLLAAGAGMLLFFKARDEDAILSLR